jgi:hypothetical protein
MAETQKGLADFMVVELVEQTLEQDAVELAEPFVSFGPETLVRSHQRVQGIYNGSIIS